MPRLAALGLYVRGHIAQAGPVAPVHSAPFHVVDGYAVHKYCHIGALESAHIGLGISEAAAVLCCPHAGVVFSTSGNSWLPIFVFYLRGVDLRQCYWGLARALVTV